MGLLTAATSTAARTKNAATAGRVFELAKPMVVEYDGLFGRALPLNVRVNAYLPKLGLDQPATALGKQAVQVAYCVEAMCPAEDVATLLPRVLAVGQSAEGIAGADHLALAVANLKRDFGPIGGRVWNMKLQDRPLNELRGLINSVEQQIAFASR